MTRAELEQEVERWRQLLLPEWRVVLLDVPFPDVEDEYFAICQTSDDYTEIRVHFTDKCLSRAREHVQVTIVHELLHALMRPTRILIDRVRPHLSYALHAELDATRQHEEEQLVDRLSRALVLFDTGLAHVGCATVRGPLDRHAPIDG